MTNKIKAYSTTPASNNASSPDGWPEGMAPSGLNNSDREFASRVREFYEDPAWIDYGHTINSSTSTTVSISGDVTGEYIVGRAIRAGQSESKVGYVTAAAYSAPNTSVTASGLDLTSVAQIELGGVKRYSAMPRSPKARAVMSVAQTITSGSVTTLIFGSETFDTDGIYDASTGAISVTTATAGYYRLNASIAFANAPAAGSAHLQVMKNGAIYSASGLSEIASGDSVSYNISSIVSLSAGDSVTVAAYHDTGLNYLTYPDILAPYFCFIEAEKLP